MKHVFVKHSSSVNKSVPANERGFNLNPTRENLKKKKKLKEKSKERVECFFMI